MPSQEPIPTIQDFLNAYRGGVRALQGTADLNRGSLVEICGGAGAILFKRLAERDRQEARNVYFDMAEKGRLDNIIERRFGVTRIRDTHGQGAARFKRTSAAAGKGWFRRGTRIAVSGSSSETLRFYVVSEDTFAAATATSVLVPIEAADIGTGTAVTVRAGDVPVLRLEDSVWDTTWTVDELTVDDGTFYEQDEAYRARARRSEVDVRVGYPTRIMAAMREAGARYVVLFASDFQGADLDIGLNRVFVADTGFESPADLLTACRLAIPAVGIAGTSLQVLPITRASFNVVATVQLYDRPTLFNLTSLKARAIAAIVEYFRNRENPFLWQESGMLGAIFRSLSAVQAVTFTYDPSDTAEVEIGTMFNQSPLPRYVIEPWNVDVTFVGPGGLSNV